MTRFSTTCACCLLLLTGSAATAAPDAVRPGMPGEPVSLNGKDPVLSLRDAVFLGLADNSAIRGAYIGRATQKAELRTMESRFAPKLALNSRHVTSQNQGEHVSQTEFSPTATLQSEYGTRFSLSWNNQITQDERGGYTRNDGTSFTVTQPLLRGARRDVVTAPLRLAQLAEQINRLNLKGTVSNTVTQIISAYNEVLRMQERLRFAREAWKRARWLLDDSMHMMAAGFDTDRGEIDIERVEVELADRELDVEEAGVRLDASRFGLLRLLGQEPDMNVRAADALDAHHTRIGLAKAQVAAREQQPEYLIQRLASERAAIELAVARDQQQWDVSLIGGASQVRNRSQTWDGTSQSNQSWENYAGVKVDIPFGDTPRRQIEVRARVNASNQNQLLIEARKALDRDVGAAVRELDTRWKQYEIAQRTLDLSRRKLDAGQGKWQTGIFGVSRALASESDLRNAEIARLDALIVYRNAQAALDRVLGTTLESWDINLND